MMIRGTLALGMIFAMAMQGVAQPAVKVVNSEFIYTSASFPSCHASTLIEVDNGIVAAWFGGTAEGKPDVGIWVSRQDQGRWSSPVEVANGQQANGTRLPCWNPVLFQAKSPEGKGPLILFYKIGPSPSTWWGVFRTSNDGGRSWSEARQLPDGILGPIKNKPVQLASGEILAPTSSEDQGWRVHFERSQDYGRTWTKTDPLNDGIEIGAIQPSVLFLGENGTEQRLMAIGRTRQKRLFQIISEDGGRTWGTMQLTSLPNPNSGTDAVTLADGRHVLVYNPTEKGRSPLNVAISEDALEWSPLHQLEDERGEFSYPAVIQTSDGLVHITYTWKRQRIKHVVLDVSSKQ